MYAKILFHEFYNSLVNFLIFFGKLFFHPRHLPAPTPMTYTHDPPQLATLLVSPPNDV